LHRDFTIEIAAGSHPDFGGFEIADQSPFGFEFNILCRLDIAIDFTF
jgi:hypothetical protein